MSESLREFVADDAWFFIGVVTFGLSVLFGLLLSDVLAGIILVIGWFLLCPILLFWGDEIALLMFGSSDEETTTDETMDPVTQLQLQYAHGDIDHEEFERRLAVLLESDQAIDDRVKSVETK